jgi:hypothetical protein
MGLIGDIFTGLGARDAAKNAASQQVNKEVEAGKLLGQAGGNAQNQVAANFNQARDNYNPYVAGGAQAVSGLASGVNGSWAAQGYGNSLPALTAGANPYATFSSSAWHTNSPYAVTANPYAATNANPQFHYDANSMTNDPSYQFRRDEALQAMQQTLHAQGITGGAAAQAAGQRASDLAATQYAQDYARQQGTFQQNFQNTLGQNQQNFTNSNLNNQQNFANTLAQNNSNFANYLGQNQANFNNTNALNQLGYNQALSNYLTGENTFHTNAGNLWQRNLQLAQLGLTGAGAQAGMQAQEGLNLANIGLDTAVRQANTTEGAGNAFAAGSIGSANAMSGLNQSITNDLSFGLSQAAKGSGSGSNGSGGGTLATLAKYAGLLGL